MGKESKPKPLADQLLGKSDQEAKLLLARAIDALRDGMNFHEERIAELKRALDAEANRVAETQGVYDGLKALVTDQANAALVRQIEGIDTRQEALEALVRDLSTASKNLAAAIENAPLSMTRAVGTTVGQWPQEMP